MIKKILFFAPFLLLTGCESKEIMTTKQIVSNEKVQMYFDRRILNKDSINISIPLEYKLIKTKKDLYGLGIIFVSNKRRLEDFKEFRIYNKANHKPLYATVELSPEKLPNHLIITKNDVRISKNQAEELLNEYKISKKVSEIKNTDTVNLIPYNQFKKDNPQIIKELNKKNDTIIFRVINGKNQKPLLIFNKINW